MTAQRVRGRAAIAPRGLARDAHRDPEMDDRAGPLLTSALEAVCGAALVLDEGLRLVGATPAAERVLGARVVPGTHAVKLLCADAPEHPLAQALTAGRAVVTTVPRLRVEGDRQVRVRATPLKDRGRPSGWLLLVAEETRSDADALELCGMWTRDVHLKKLFRLAERVARSDVNVLIEGEMGTGKASLAAAIHARSPRSAAPLRAVTCASATPELVARHMGAGGTLLFDDVSELSPDTQAELLRLLEGIAVPVDGIEVAADARVVAATRVPLSREVERGRLRADLMYRLRIVSLHLPPLRARRGDVRLLVEKFVAAENARGGRRVERVAPAALERLEAHAWPGNVRELRVAIESAFATADGPVLALADLPPEVAEPFAPPTHASVPPPPSTPPAEADEASRIRRALERAAGDRARAASMLGMSRTTLWRRMRALGVAPKGAP